MYNSVDGIENEYLSCKYDELYDDDLFSMMIIFELRNDESQCNISDDRGRKEIFVDWSGHFTEVKRDARIIDHNSVSNSLSIEGFSMYLEIFDVKVENWRETNKTQSSGITSQWSIRQIRTEVNVWERISIRVSFQGKRESKITYSQRATRRSLNIFA